MFYRGSKDDSIGTMIGDVPVSSSAQLNGDYNLWHVIEECYEHIVQVQTRERFSESQWQLYSVVQL